MFGKWVIVKWQKYVYIYIKKYNNYIWGDLGIDTKEEKAFENTPMPVYVV